MKFAAKPFCVIAGLCILIYFPALSGSFLTWDDTQHIVLNPWLTLGKVGYFWTHTYYGMFIPVTYTLWSWLYAVSSSPVLFHVFHLVLHVLNSYMVFKLVGRVFPKVDSGYALIAAALFACHPLQVEAVAWISGGRDLLSATFGLSALLLAKGSEKKRFAIASVVMFGLSLLAKPSLLLLPVAALCIVRIRRSIFWSWTIASLLVGAVAISIQGEWAAQRTAVAAWERVVVALDTIGFYFGKILLPFPLMADYGRDPRTMLESFAFIPSLFLLGAGIGFFIWLKNRGGRMAYGIAGFFVLSLLPVMGFVPFAAQTVSTVFDRYMYFPMLAVALTIPLLPKNRRLFHAAIVLLAAFSALSFSNTWKWRSSDALSRDMIEKNPRSYDGHNNLALVEIDAKNWFQAKQLLRVATSLKPDSAVAWSNLGYVYWSERDLVAIFADIDPRLQSAQFVERNRNEPQALGLMYRMGARAYSSVRKMDVAKDYYCHALKYNPLDTDLRGEVKDFLKGGDGC